MSYKLPTLAVAAWFGFSVSICLAQVPAAAPRQAGQGTTDGQQLVAQAARNVHAEPSIKANLRYRVEAFGHQLVGSGSYLQLGAGPQKLLRLELKTQVGDQIASVQEFCGRQSYWIRRELPQGNNTLGRVNLNQLYKAMERSAQNLPASPGQTWIMLGGLPKLLAGLDQNFRFGAARADELEFPSADNRVDRMPVWIVQGEWKPDSLAALLKRKGVASVGELPAQLPERVELVLGRDEQVLPLFPYRITYLRRPSGEATTSATGAVAPPTELVPMIALELFDVSRRDNLDEREFEYNPGDQQVEDLTLTYMKKLGIEAR